MFQKDTFWLLNLVGFHLKAIEKRICQGADHNKKKEAALPRTASRNKQITLYFSPRQMLSC